MRILFLTDHYPPHTLGGYGIACQLSVAGLAARGHDVLVLTHGPKGREDLPHVEQVLHRTQDSPSLARLAVWEVLDHARLRRVIRRFAPDVVSCWRMWHFFPSLHGLLRASGVPLVYNLHDLWLPLQAEAQERLSAEWARPAPSALKNGAKAALRWAIGQLHPGFPQPLRIADVDLRFTVSCSRYVVSQHAEAGIVLGEKQVIYNGIDVSAFHGAPVARAPGEELRVLFAGRLVHEKGAHVALEAIGRLRAEGRPVKLTIAGVPSYPWDYPEMLHSRVAALGLTGSVQFLESVPPATMPSVYRDHHVLVFPSAKIEGLPLTLLEAMACGCAVVTTLTGGTGELAEDGRNCLTCPPEDAAALAGCLVRLADEPGLANRLASTGQQLVGEHFNALGVAAVTEAYLQSCVERSRERRRPTQGTP